VFIALIIQHPMGMRCIVLSSVPCPAVQYLSTLSHKLHYFRNKIREYKVFVFILSKNLVWNISRSKKNWATYDPKCILVFI